MSSRPLLRLTVWMPTDAWQIDVLDLAGYLSRLGAPVREPSRAALAELHEAHVRAFTFDNIDVLLGQHPGVSLDAPQEKFVVRGRGGYCFEHSTIFAAALERLGYQAGATWGGSATRRRTPSRGAPTWWSRWFSTVSDSCATPASGSACCDRFRWPMTPRTTTSPGGGTSCAGPRGRLALYRMREEGWELAHTTDELEVKPVDVVMGHHYTSTYPGSHFTTGFMVGEPCPPDTSR